MSIFVILGIVYVLSLFIFRICVKKDIRDGWDVPATLALMLTILPIINTIMIIVWCLARIDLDEISEKFFNEN